MLLTIPLSIACVAGLIHPVLAAIPEASQLEPLSIDVTKRVTGRPHRINGTDQVDFGSVGSHVRGMKVSSPDLEGSLPCLVPPPGPCLTSSLFCSFMLLTEQVCKDESQSRRLYGSYQESCHLAHPAPGHRESTNTNTRRRLRSSRPLATDLLTSYPRSAAG